jgi:hypothetical protein
MPRRLPTAPALFARRSTAFKSFPDKTRTLWITKINVSRATSWSAVALHRFSGSQISSSAELNGATRAALNSPLNDALRTQRRSRRKRAGARNTSILQVTILPSEAGAIMRRQKQLHFISPDWPAVKARTTPALLFLQENKSMVLTVRKGFGFSIAVRLKSNGRFPSGVKDPPSQAALELVPVGCAFFMLPGVLKSIVSMPYRMVLVTE